MVDDVLSELCISPLIGATVVVPVTFAGDACRRAPALIVVTFEAPTNEAIFELAVSVTVPVAPPARTRLDGDKVEALKEPVFESLTTLRLNVVGEHAPVSVFFILTM